jgi:hypothetical protein
MFREVVDRKWLVDGDPLTNITLLENPGKMRKCATR